MTLSSQAADRRWPAHLAQALPTAAALGMLAWVGQHHVEHSAMAVALLLLIGAVFLAGAWNLHRFRRDSAALDLKLQQTVDTPADAAAWLAALPASLRSAVRARLEGHWLALPGPTLAPFLTGLLVLLGMLGTFLGMVATLRGTGLALNSAADVQAIRGLLTAPIQGLGQAFGTSVAGVAASALLGLMSAAARRERLASTQRLDAAIAHGPLAPLTLAARARADALETAAAAERAAAAARAESENQAGQWREWLAQQQALASEQARQQAQFWAEQHGRLQASLHSQTEALQAMASRVGAVLQHSQDSAQGLQQGQAQFHAQTDAAYRELARSVAASLQHSLGEQVPSAVQAAVQAAVLPMLEQTRAAVAPALDQVLAQLSHTQAALAETVQGSTEAHLAHTHQALDGLLSRVGEHLERSQAHSSERLEAHSRQVLAQLQQQHQQGQQDWAQAQALWRASQQAALDSGAAQARQHTEATIGQLQTLVQAAAEAPRVAAELMGQLRQALSDSLVRDTAAMAEREQTLSALQQLLHSVNAAQAQQHEAQQQLLEEARVRLQQQAEAFAARVDEGSQALQQAREHTVQAATGVERWSVLLEQAVAQWGSSSHALAQQLQGIEQALAHTLARSDEQLAYYVAQAREVVDLTLGAHQQMVSSLQAAQPAPAGPAAPPRVPEAA